MHQCARSRANRLHFSQDPPLGIFPNSITRLLRKFVLDHIRAFHPNPSTIFSRYRKFWPSPYGYNSSGPRTFVHGLQCLGHGLGGHGLGGVSVVVSRPSLYLHGLHGLHLCHGLHWWPVVAVAVSPVVAVCLHWWRWWPVPRWRSPFRRPRPRWWRWWYKVFPPPRPSLVAVVVVASVVALVAVCAFSSASASFVLVWWSPRSRPPLIYAKGLGLGGLLGGGGTGGLGVVAFHLHGLQCLHGLGVVVSSVMVSTVAVCLGGGHGLGGLGVSPPVFETGGHGLGGHFL